MVGRLSFRVIVIFFKNGDDDYLFLRKFILSYITNTNDISHVNKFCDEDLFSRLACI